MKVYIVEMSGFCGGSRRYGVYSNIESARNKLKEIFEEEKERTSKCNYIYKVGWHEFIKDSFYVQYGLKEYDEITEVEVYEITEVEVEDGNN